MSIESIQSMLPKQTEQILPGGIAASDLKKVPKSPQVGLSPKQATMVQKQPGIVRDLVCLTKLKAQIQRTRRGRGPKRQRRMRRRRLQRRYRMVHKRLMGRLRRHFNRYRHHGCHRHHPGNSRVQGASTNQSQGANTNQGGDFSFLDDPNLSMSEKIEMFLEQCAKQTEAKMQELMKQYEDQGKSGSKNDIKRKVVGFFTKAGAAVASVYGGPAAGAAVNTAGNAINDATDSKSSKEASETDQRMTMFKIQKLQSQMDEMFQLFSKISNSDDETKKRIIANV